MNPSPPEITFEDLYANHERIVAEREAKNKQIKLPSWLAFGNTETRLRNLQSHSDAKARKEATE
jgi:hypothetical protein